MSIEFSVILCTRNRAHLLRAALASLAEIDYPADRCEIVIVDNGSSDDTAAVVRAASERAPLALRYVFEARPGLSVARNRGAEEAAGEYVSFTDDDQLVDKAILREYRRVVNRYGARVVQGSIELLFPEGRPAWIRSDLAAVLGQTSELPEGPADIELYGGNMLFSRDVLRAAGGFREDLGKGASGYCEDSELTERVRRLNESIVYAPSARVFHVIGPDRSTPRFFRHNSFEKGLSQGLIAGHSLPRVAASLMPSLLSSALGAALFSVTGDQHRSIRAQARAANLLGRLVGRARRSLA
jgi:GT2 family glycosyltransferase